VTRPPDDVPTTVLPQPTVEQPSVTTSPATRRSYTWHRRIPARIGRARSSTLVIGALFVLLGGLNALLPTRDTGTTPVVLPSGQTVSVPNSAIPSEARPTAPAPATREPASPTPATPTETSAPPTTTEQTSAPPTRSSAAPTSTPSATRTTTTSTRPPSTSAVPTATADEDEVTPARTAVPTAPTGTADPTG
jgi:hypothetical protein